MHDFNPYWTGRTNMFFPGKGPEGHICPTIVTSFRVSSTW